MSRNPSREMEQSAVPEEQRGIFLLLQTQIKESESKHGKELKEAKELHEKELKALALIMDTKIASGAEKIASIETTNATLNMQNVRLTQQHEGLAEHQKVLTSDVHRSNQ